MANPKQQVYLGTGRRKTAVARVRISEGTGQITINERPLDHYFTEDKDRTAVIAPLDLCGLRTKVNVVIRCHGGGFTGQAGACLQGVARALKEMYGGDATVQSAKASADGQAPAPGADGGEPPAEDTTPVGFIKKLRDSGYLTRDGRMKERKKYGRKGARKSFQFSKR
jgi:small subunit ribosomal protein S9